MCEEGNLLLTLTFPLYRMLLGGECHKFLEIASNNETKSIPLLMSKKNVVNRHIWRKLFIRRLHS